MKTIIIKNLSVVLDHVAVNVAGAHLKAQKDAAFVTIYDYLTDNLQVAVKVSEDEISGKVTFVIKDKETTNESNMQKSEL